MAEPDLNSQIVPRDVSEAQALLRDSLSEAQMNVRSYDTKAQIVGVGYIFALGIIGEISTFLDRDAQITFFFVPISWALMILPIIFFGYVLYPTRKTTSYTDAPEHDGIQHVLYIDPTKKKTVDAVRQASLKAVTLDELSFELLTVSSLRDIKRQRFLRALFASAISFFGLFLIQMFRTG